MANEGHHGKPSGHGADVGSPSVERPQDWWLYRGTGQPLDPSERDQRWPKPPPWRTFPGGPDLPVPPLDEAETRRRLGTPAVARSADPNAISMVNAAIYLSRPLIVTGR